MQTLWFILVGFMLIMYVVLDGFDLGAGAIHLFAAKNEPERRMILRAIGPVWDGNEVWLIAAGGTLFFTFPLLYASSFSGFYLPLIIVLWLLMFRGVSVELRSRIANPVWASFWDGMFFLGSALLAIFFGAAMANVIRGVPLDKSGIFFEALWTDFNPFSANPGILDWYTVLVGLIGVGYFNFRQRDLASFISSCAFIVGMLASVAFGLYPLLLPAVNRANSLTIYNASASQYALTVGLVWWIIGMILAVIYFT